MKKLLVSALFCVSSLAFAGDAAKLTHVGFSADGQNYAFMESGINDGMGNAYARVRFIELAGNKYAAPAVEKVQTEEEMETPGMDLASVEADVLKKSEETMKTLNISSSVKGDVVISRKLTDLAARKLTDASFSIYPIIGGLTSPTYKITLTKSKATVSAAHNCMDPAQAKKIKLELTNDQTKKTSVLQADASLPTSRGCTHNYEIEDVVVIQPDQMSDAAAKVVVLLRVYTVGFEGEDVRYMAVSGSLNKI